MKQLSIARLCGMALNEMDAGILIASNDGSVEFMNSWIEDRLPLFQKKKVTVKAGDPDGPFASIMDVLKNRGEAGPTAAFIGVTSVSLAGRRVCDDVEGSVCYVILARAATAEKAGKHHRFSDIEQISGILDTFADGYYEFDADGNFTHANKSFCSFTGYGPDELIGKNFRMLVDEEAAGNILDSIRSLRKEEGASKIYNWELIRRDGKKCSVEVSLSLLNDENGNPVGYRGLLRDTTERRRMEEELVLARKIEAIGIMAGGIAHDYNNALTAVLGNLSLAKMETNPENRELFEVLNDAEAAALRVLELTKRLSTFAKGGKPKLVPVSPDILKDVIRDTMDSVLKGFPGTCTIIVARDLRLIEVDPAQFSHVVEHIANNAKEAMPDGGTIAVEVGNVIVDSEKSFNEITLYPDDYVLLSIKDSGKGVPADIIERIFDPYFTTKEIATGMGLTICYAIVKRHHGFVEVLSEQGRGTTVNVYLPVVKN